MTQHHRLDEHPEPVVTAERGFVHDPKLVRAKEPGKHFPKDAGTDYHHDQQAVVEHSPGPFHGDDHVTHQATVLESKGEAHSLVDSTVYFDDINIIEAKIAHESMPVPPAVDVRIVDDIVKHFRTTHQVPMPQVVQPGQVVRVLGKDPSRIRTFLQMSAGENTGPAQQSNVAYSASFGQSTAGSVSLPANTPMTGFALNIQGNGPQENKPANPAAGADISVGPGGNTWGLVTFTFTLTTSATVGNRVITVQITDGATVLWTSAAQTAQTAGTTQTYTYSTIIASNTTGMPAISLLPGWLIKTVTTGLLAGDQYSNISITFNQIVVGNVTVTGLTTSGGQTGTLTYPITLGPNGMNLEVTFPGPVLAGAGLQPTVNMPQLFVAGSYTLTIFGLAGAAGVGGSDIAILGNPEVGIVPVKSNAGQFGIVLPTSPSTLEIKSEDEIWIATPSDNTGAVTVAFYCEYAREARTREEYQNR